MNDRRMMLYRISTLDTMIILIVSVIMMTS
jgi:hypothetical protein